MIQKFPDSGCIVGKANQGGYTQLKAINSLYFSAHCLNRNPAELYEGDRPHPRFSHEFSVLVLKLCPTCAAGFTYELF
jgi:hypothetical protein